MKLLKFLLLIFALNISAPLNEISKTPPKVNLENQKTQRLSEAHKIIIEATVSTSVQASEESIKSPECRLIIDILKKINNKEEKQEGLNQYCITCGSFFAVFATCLGSEEIEKIVSEKIENFRVNVYTCIFPFLGKDNLTTVFSTVKPFFISGKACFAVIELEDFTIFFAPQN